MSLSQEGTTKKKMSSSFEIFSHSLIASGNNINNNEFHNFPSLSYLNQAIYYIKPAIEELHYYNLHKNNPNDIKVDIPDLFEMIPDIDDGNKPVLP